jgi:hypothetical protein
MKRRSSARRATGSGKNPRAQLVLAVRAAHQPARRGGDLAHRPAGAVQAVARLVNAGERAHAIPPPLAQRIGRNLGAGAGARFHRRQQPEQGHDEQHVERDDEPGRRLDAPMGQGDPEDHVEPDRKHQDSQDANSPHGFSTRDGMGSSYALQPLRRPSRPHQRPHSQPPDGPSEVSSPSRAGTPLPAAVRLDPDGAPGIVPPSHGSGAAPLRRPSRLVRRGPAFSFDLDPCGTRRYGPAAARWDVRR